MNLNTHILALVGKAKKNGVSYIHIFKDSKFYTILICLFWSKKSRPGGHESKPETKARTG
jgi:hypothetical protein